MFRADLFITVQNWKEPKCPSTSDWMLYIHVVNTTQQQKETSY